MPSKSLTSEPDYQRFWSRFQQMGALANRGMTEPAIQIITELLQHPRRAEFDPFRQVDYSHAVLLLGIPGFPEGWNQSIKILQDLLKADIPQQNPGQLRVELAAAFGLLGDWNAAKATALEAVKLTEEAPALSALAYQNLGRAHLELGETDQAQTKYLEMLDHSLRGDELKYAGVAADWLARIAKTLGKAEVAGVWHDLAFGAYQNHAPQHLKTLADVTAWLKSTHPERADIRFLPPQAKALRDKLPPAGEVSDYAGNHLDELYVDLGSLHLAADLSLSEACGFAIPLPFEGPQVHESLRGLLAAQCRAILPHERAYELVTQIMRELWPGSSETILARWSRPNVVKWVIEPPRLDGQLPALAFYSDGVVPAAYGSMLQGLAWLFLMGYEARQRKLQEFSSAMGGMTPQFLNLSDRRWPLPVQTWMILHGQSLAGGETGPSTLADEATRINVSLPDQNKRDFQKMNFTVKEATELDEGGLIALLASRISVPGGGAPTYIGTCPLNEVNLANRPATLDNPGDESRPGFVIDREYNTWYFAPSPKHPDHAWYGMNNALFRDHFAPFHNQIKITGSVRAKHFAIPILDIDTPNELTRINALLTEAAERLKPTKHVPLDARVWFRGQTKGRLLPRTPKVCRFLFGKDQVDEPSLPGAAPRRGWNYHRVHSFLSTMLQKLIYTEAKARGVSFENTYRQWREFSQIPGQWDLAVMLLAQHYGVPTHGIDITSDIDVALWFATNRYVSLPDGTFTYRPLAEAEWKTDPSAWPVIYAILPVTHSLDGAIQEVELPEQFGIEALRPRRQKAAFFMGATGTHRNRLAEALVCILRLCPSQWTTKSSYTELFPAPKDDLPYEWFLNLKQNFTTGQIGKFLDEIPRYVNA